MKSDEYSIMSLAFIGDAHYNLYVKRTIIDKRVKVNDMQKDVAKLCSAKGQARFMKHLIDNNLLSEQELAIYKRGRNTKTHAAPKNTDAVTYRVSTGFEALWGYWYLNEQFDRMEQIWEIIETLGE